MAAPGVERLFPAARPSSLGGLVAEPVALRMGGEDGIRVSVLNVAVGLRLGIVARFVEEGKTSVTSMLDSFTPTTDGAESSRDLPLPAGALLNLAVFPSVSIVSQGQCYVRADVTRGRGSRMALGTLLAGYVGSWGGLAWPGTPLRSPLEGPGLARTYSSAVPGAGAAALLIQAPRTRWRTTAVTCSLTTSAVAGNRTPVLVIRQGGTIAVRAPAPFNQPASSTRSYCWNNGAAVQAAFVATNVLCSMAMNVLTEGAEVVFDQFEIAVEGMDAGDQLTALVVMVEEWRNPTTTFDINGLKS